MTQLMADPRFGRLIEFDERSRNYSIRSLLEAEAAPTTPRSYTWRCSSYLDQGQEPSCVGFSVTHEALGRPAEVTGLSQDIARHVYKRAQQLDQWPGESYAGTSVLAGIKAGQEMGWYGEYRWAFSMEDLLLAVGYRGPAILGINWYSGMLSPDQHYLIHPTGQVVGGHAILCNGVSLKLRQVRLHNSWGPGWGQGGDCFLSFDDLDRLLHEQGEACVPIKRYRYITTNSGRVVRRETPREP